MQLKFEDPLCQCQIIKKDCSTKNSQPQSINEARRGVVFGSSVKFLPASVAKAQEVENCPLENLKQSKVISENLKRGRQSFLNNSCCCQLEILEVSDNCYIEVRAMLMTSLFKHATHANDSSFRFVLKLE